MILYLMTHLQSRFSNERGAVGAEYAILLTVLAAAVATGAAVLGPKLISALSNALP